MNDVPFGPRATRGLAALAVLGLVAASPPAWFPGAEWLVLPGLAGLYAIARRAARPYFTAWLVGALHVAAFSWSVRHVSFVAWALIGLAGGVYYLLAAAWTRGFATARMPVTGFALGAAATCWLRAHIVEIPYPHGQFAHALHEWPGLLGPVRWGGEVWMNGLLAAVAAAAAEPLVGAGRGVVAALRIALLAALWIALAAFRPPAPTTDPAPPVAVLAVEPGVHPEAPLGTRDFLVRTHVALVDVTVEALGAASADVVLWPESGLPEVLSGDPPRLLGLPAPMRRLALPATTVLVAGSTRSWQVAGGTAVGRRVVAVALDHRLRLAAYQEKRRTVPAGERLPFANWLPASLAAPLRVWASGLVGIPDYADGDRRPPVVGPDGVPFAALVCYDNAFDDVCRDAVADGARWLAVLSNEAWYRQGAELEQMVAMSVFRALETGTPVVRATVDGRSIHVDADGVVVARARPLAVAATDVGSPAALLRTSVAPGPGRLGPFGSAQRWWGPAAAVSGAIAAVLLGLARRRRRASAAA